MKKSDRTQFDKNAPLFDPYHDDPMKPQDTVKPAEIKYCGGHWVFSHDYIRKSKKDKVRACDVVFTACSMHCLNCVYLIRVILVRGIRLQLARPFA